MTDLATSEVVDGEVVGRAEVPPPPKIELYTRPRRAQIIEALTGTRKDQRTKAFLADAARFAGISPQLLYAWLEHGRAHPNGPLGRFARDVDRIRAEHNVDLKADMEALARERKDWTGLARIGEQYDAETWSRPSEGKGTTINVNIVDKLTQVHAKSGNPLTSGD